MRKHSICSFVLVTFILNNRSVHCFEPFTILGASTVAAGTALFGIWYKYNPERCNSKLIDNEVHNLNNDLNIRVYGQHLVKSMVTKLIGQHMKNENPDKALVMSFHGWPGNGKNLVSEIVAKNIFKSYHDSKSSDFVRYFFCSHFHTLDKQLIRNSIKTTIIETVKKCPRALFIFDEIDKLDGGVVDVIKPFIDFNPFVDSVDYRKSIFIFLSNTGGEAINKKTFDFYMSGKERTDITWKDMESLIDSGAFNEMGGLHKSDIVANSLINVYVPFLPLEKKHVRLCVIDYLRDHCNKSNPQIDPGEEFIREVSNQMEYHPPDTQIFSKTGCKKVGPKVDVYL